MIIISHWAHCIEHCTVWVLEAGGKDQLYMGVQKFNSCLAVNFLKSGSKKYIWARGAKIFVFVLRIFGNGQQTNRHTDGEADMSTL